MKYNYSKLELSKSVLRDFLPRKNINAWNVLMSKIILNLYAGFPVNLRNQSMDDLSSQLLFNHF